MRLRTVEYELLAFTFPRNPKDIQPVIDAAYKYKYISTMFDAKDLIAS